jgi:hypothetical protein
LDPDDIQDQGSTLSTIKLIRLTRLAKMLRLVRVRRLLERHLERFASFLHIIKGFAVMTAGFYAAHLLCCLWFAVGLEVGGDSDVWPQGWVVRELSHLI